MAQVFRRKNVRQLAGLGNGRGMTECPSWYLRTGLLQSLLLSRFPSATLVVPLGLLAPQRRWNLLYSLSARPLHCGRGGGLLHHHKTLLVVSHNGQSASESAPSLPLILADHARLSATIVGWSQRNREEKNLWIFSTASPY